MALPPHGHRDLGLPYFPAAPVLIEGREPAVRPGISEAEAAMLRQLAKGASVLEVGSAFGYSTIVMALVARSVVSVDPHILLDSLDTFLDNIDAHGVDSLVRLMVTESTKALPLLLKEGRRFDLIFIDGDHSQAAVRFDAMWSRNLITDKGVIAFHDYQPEVRETVFDGLVSWPPPDALVGSLAVFYGPWH